MPTGHRCQFNVYSMLVQHNFIEITWKQHCLQPVCAQWVESMQTIRRTIYLLAWLIANLYLPNIRSWVHCRGHTGKYFKSPLHSVPVQVQIVHLNPTRTQPLKHSNKFIQLSFTQYNSKFHI
jgi:hypothetical protein